jgi:hypothetical protein
MRAGLALNLIFVVIIACFVYFVVISAWGNEA